MKRRHFLDLLFAAPVAAAIGKAPSVEIVPPKTPLLTTSNQAEVEWNMERGSASPWIGNEFAYDQSIMFVRDEESP